MFRAAQANPFDEPVVRATDENLTQEDWGLIMTVVDKVESEENGGKDAVAAMIKRLAHRNANVQLYTLELANSLSQNIGIKIHKELASRSFTDALLRLANDRNTHQQVKTRILERMTEWAEMFSSNPDLGIMEQAYGRLKSQNPSLQPPSKPFKKEITDTDRQKEEQELQMALALSIKEKPSDPRQKRRTTEREDSTPTPASSSQQAAPSHSQGTTAATVSRVRALFDFQPSEPGELQFRKGDIIAVLESVYKDWWRGSLRGQQGIFPLNYVEKLQDPTQEELERESQMEAEVFGEIKNVEKLLSLLSTSGADLNVRDNEEITGLYQQTVAIRPKLIELIGKYSQKKDDMTQLNEKFIKARRDYEALLEQSMSQQQHGMYGRPPPGPSYGGFGGPPPQQDLQRFYTPAPQNAQTDGYGHSGAGPPGRDGPAPFYVIPPGQQPPQQLQHQQQPPPQSQYPPQPDYAKPSSPNQYPPHHAPQPQQTPQSYPQPPIAELGRTSLYSQNPQELATSNYEPPPSQQHQQSYPPPPQQQQQQYSQQYTPQPPNRSSSHYSDSDDLYAHPGQQQQSQPYQLQTGQGPGQGQKLGSYDSQQSAPQSYPAPSHAPPGVPPPQGSSMTGSPPPMHAQPYVSSSGPGYGQGNPDIPAPLQPSHAPVGYQYQPYKPPGAGVGVGAGGGQDDVSDYYR